MNIGYACLTEGIMNTKYKTCRMDNINYERLVKLISHNLYSLENTIDYNKTLLNKYISYPYITTIIYKLFIPLYSL